MMLNNGCLCCTVREDLVGMLNELVCPKEAGLQLPFPVIYSPTRSRQRSAPFARHDVESQKIAACVFAVILHGTAHVYTTNLLNSISSM